MPPDAEKRLRPYVWAGAVLVLVGIGLTAGGAASAGSAGIEVLGITLIVIGSAFFGGNLIAIAWLRKHK